MREFLEAVRRQGLAEGNMLGLLHVLIGRRITRQDGTVVCSGLSWRELAAWLKKVRWDKEAVRQLGLDPTALPPRDRQRYWYSAITQAGVDSAEATRAGDQLAKRLEPIGYLVSPAPLGTATNKNPSSEPD